MKGQTPSARIVVDGYTRFCLTVIAVLLTVLIIGLWATGPVAPAIGGAAPRGTGEAQPAGIGNPSAQRLAIVRGINTTNEKLGKIIDLLKSGKIEVVVAEREAGNVPAKVQKPGSK